jgi:hypothetical protein
MRWSRDQFTAAKRATESVESGDEVAENGRAFFQAVSEVCNIYSHPANWRGSDPIIPMPRDLAQSLGGLLGYVAVGKMPEAISDVIVRRGRTPFGPTEERNVRIGCATFRIQPS